MSVLKMHGYSQTHANVLHCFAGLAKFSWTFIPQNIVKHREKLDSIQNNRIFQASPLPGVIHDTSIIPFYGGHWMCRVPMPSSRNPTWLENPHVARCTHGLATLSDEFSRALLPHGECGWATLGSLKATHSVSWLLNPMKYIDI